MHDTRNRADDIARRIELDAAFDSGNFFQICGLASDLAAQCSIEALEYALAEAVTALGGDAYRYPDNDYKTSVLWRILAHLDRMAGTR